MFLLNEMHIWLLGTAVLFTILGMWMSGNKWDKYTTVIIEATIDRLIKDGYIKARIDKNGEIELLKYNEE